MTTTIPPHHTVEESLEALVKTLDSIKRGIDEISFKLDAIADASKNASKSLDSLDHLAGMLVNHTIH
jgi:hypothetical protein